MNLVCIRHLPTEWNLRRVMQGQRDIPALEPDAASLEAIARNREALPSLGPFDIVVASALSRTQQTAAHYGYPDAVVEPLLNELSFGSWEGRPRAELEAELGDRWLGDPRELVLGEPLAEFTNRIRRFLAKYSVHGRVLAFAHGSWMRGLVSIARHGDVRGMNRFFIENSEVHAFEVSNGGSVVREQVSTRG
ncbi:MAG: histidine phosphatase family protein [bacterium]|nr:histidine phosphatase family protein [bacterium]